MSDVNNPWRRGQVVVRLRHTVFPKTHEYVLNTLRELWGCGVDPGEEVESLLDELQKAGVLTLYNGRWSLDTGALATWEQGLAEFVPPSGIQAATGTARGKGIVH